MQHQRSSCGSVSDRALLRRRAFTLLELLVVIAIIATLTFVAVPAFKGFGQANTLAAAQRQIQDDLALARQLAIKNRVPVYLVFFSPDPEIQQAFAVQLNSIHTTLSGLTASEYQEHALRVFTNLFAGQHSSYAFYSEGKVGDQPFLAGSSDDGTGAIRRGRYLTVGGTIWRTLPEGIVFAPGLRIPLQLGVTNSLTTKVIPFPLVPDAGDPGITSANVANLQLRLPAIAYDALGRAMKLDPQTGRFDVNAAPQDQFVSIGIGSVFMPHEAVATNNYDFTRLADVVETPRANYTNTIFRVTGLTGRARKFVYGTQP